MAGTAQIERAALKQENPKEKNHSLSIFSNGLASLILVEMIVKVIQADAPRRGVVEVKGRSPADPAPPLLDPGKNGGRVLQALAVDVGFFRIQVPIDDHG